MAWRDRLRRGYSALFRASASQDSLRRRRVPLAVEGIEDRVAPVALTLIAPLATPPMSSEAMLPAGDAVPANPASSAPPRFLAGLLREAGYPVGESVPSVADVLRYWAHEAAQVASEAAHDRSDPATPIPPDSAPAARSDAGPASTPDSETEKRPDVSSDEKPPPNDRRDAGLDNSPLGDALEDKTLADILARSRESNGGNAPVAAVAVSNVSEGNGAAAGGAASAAAGSNSEPPPLAQNSAGHDAQVWNSLGTGTPPATGATPVPTVLPAAPIARPAASPSPLPAASPAQVTSTPAFAPVAQTAPSPTPTNPPAPPPTGSGGLAGIDPSIVAVEGTGFGGTVAQFTDGDGNTNATVYRTTITWGDGTAATGGMVSYANGTFSVQSSHTYLEEGASFTATTSVFDTADNSSVTITSPATVSDATLSAGGTNSPPLQLSVGTPFSGSLGSFEDADPNGAQADYSGTTVNWGDGTAASAGTVAGGGNGFSVSGGHTYTQAGSFTVQVSLQDAGGASLTFQDSAVVTSATGGLNASAVNPTLVEGSTSPIPVATFSDPDGNTYPSYTANISWGDGQSSGGSVFHGNNSFSVQGTHGYAEVGSYTLTTTISDSADGASATVSGTATVTEAALSWNNGAPSFYWNATPTPAPGITAPGNQTSTEGDAIVLPVTASDPNNYSLTYAAVNLPDGLHIDSGTGLISGPVAYSAAESSGGVYPVTVLVANGHGGSVTQTFTWTVADSNQTPALSNPGNQSNLVGDRVYVQLQARDPNGDQLLYTATGLPGGLTLDGVTGEIYGTLDSTGPFNGPTSVTVTAANQTKSASQTFTWTVTLPPGGPVLPTLSDQSNAPGDSVLVSIQAPDPNGDPVSYTVSGLPPGVIFDPANARVTGTIDPAAATGSPYTVTVQASDALGSSTQTFHWTVHPVSVVPLDDQVNINGDAVSLPVSASDANNRPLTYSATGLPPGLGISSSTGLISGPLATTADNGSPYTVTVTVTAGSDSASQSFTWTVGHLSLSVVADRSDVEGASVSVPMAGHDVDGDAVTYSATGLPPGVTINAATGLIAGVLGSTASRGSPYVVTVTVFDGTNTTRETFNWTITPHVLLATPATQTNAPGDVVSLAVTGVDATGQTLTFSAVGLPPGLAINPSTGTIAGTLSAHADSGSPYFVTVTASDGTFSSSQTFAWAVTHVVLTNPGDQSNVAGDSVSVTVLGRDSDGVALAFSATGLPPGVTINSSTGVLGGTVAAGADLGSPYLVTITASEGAFTSSQSFAWVVSAGVTVQDPGDQVSVGGDTVSLAIAATDSQGGSLFYSATGLPSGLAINASTGAIAGTIAPSAVSASPYAVTVTATDGSYGASQSFTWTVAAVGVSNPGPLRSVVGSTISLPLVGADAAGRPLSFSAVNLPPGLSLNLNTGLIGGVLSAAAAGNRYPVTVTVTDGINSSSQSFLWEVAGLALSNPGDQTSTEGVAVSLPLTAQDGNGRPLTYSADGLPPGLSINPNTGTIAGTTPVGQGGTDSFAVTVTVADGVVSTRQTFQWSVLHRARLDNPGPQTNAEGDVVSLQLSADGDGVTFSATGLPAGLVLDSSSGLIAGPVGYAAAETNGGTYPVTVTAQDDLGNSAMQTFTWTVTDGHFAAQGVDVSATEGTAASVPVAHFSVDDLTLAASAFTATISWGDGTPATTGIVSGASGTFAVSGSHTYAAAGVDPVSVTIGGPDGSLSTTSNAVVDDAVLVSADTSLSAVEGVLLSSVTVASFSDPAGLDSVSGDTATIKWGDGGTDTGRVFASGNTVYVTGSHSYTRSGNYQVSTSLQSGGGSSASATAQVSVADAALTAGGETLAATEGQSANLTVATFADPNSNALNGDFQVSINWGDGTTDAADNVTGAPANFSVVSSHTYSHFGSYTVHTTVTDSGGATATATSQVTVADAAVTATGVNLALLTNGLPNGPVATFIDANPGSQASDFSATINWGNGLTSPGTVAGWGGVFTVSNDIVYQQSGTYPVSITIREQGQVIATAAATATVGDLLEGRASTLTVASFSDANPVGPGSYMASIAWGDGTTTAGTVQGGNGQYSVQGTHAYKSAAAFTITVSVVDGSSSLSFTGSVRVADAPLTVLAANVSPVEGQPLSSVPVAIFTDANPYSTAADFAPLVTWDDSTASSVGAVSGSDTGPIFTVLASHLYANAGVYATEVIVGQVGGGTGVGQAKGPDGPAAKAFVKPNWNDATKYKLMLGVGDPAGQERRDPAHLRADDPGRQQPQRHRRRLVDRPGQGDAQAARDPYASPSTPSNSITCCATSGKVSWNVRTNCPCSSNK